MGILEKLRPTPRWKHADPSVRAAAVYDIGPDEADALRALAREDADARVRRAAVTRLDDVAVLADVAQHAIPTKTCAAEAVRGLAGFAAEADDVSRRDRCRSSTARPRPHQGSHRRRARQHQQRGVRAAVVDLLDDQKALGSVSRHAQDNATRLRALARVTDEEELLNVALKSEHTDVGGGGARAHRRRRAARRHRAARAQQGGRAPRARPSFARSRSRRRRRADESARR